MTYNKALITKNKSRKVLLCQEDLRGGVGQTGNGNDNEVKGKPSVIVPGNVTGNIVLGENNVIEGELQKNPTLPTDAIVVDGNTQTETGFDPNELVDEIARVMRKARKAATGVGRGQAAGKGEVKVDGSISESNVVLGDGQRVNTAEQGEDLPIGTEVAVKVIGLSVENSNVTVVDKEGRESQKFLKGYWVNSRRTDAFGNKIFVREE